MKERLEHLNEKFSDYSLMTMQDFMDHPIKYPFDCVKEFIRDYYDAGISVGAGLAWTPFGDGIYGNHVGEAMFGGPALAFFTSFIGRSNKEGREAFDRNYSIGLSTCLAGIDYENVSTITVETIYKGLEAFFAIGAILFEIDRIKTKDSHEQQKQSELKLEKVV